jgi:hypothetical protein
MTSSDATTVLRAQERAVIVQIASMIMDSAKSLSSWSKNISSSFHMGSVNELPDGMMITIGNSAPEAHAFEHGSGIHGPGGEKYPIVPVNASALAFFGTHGFGNAYSAYNRSTREGVGEQNIVVTQHVSHPGVGAHPFMAPAVEANRAAALELLKQAVGSAVRLTIREAWHKQ